MLSPKLSNTIPVISVDQNPPKNAESKHPTSICSCSLCDSNSCFKIRNQKSLLSCTCSTLAIDKGSNKCLLLVQSESKKNTPIPKQERNEEIIQEIKRGIEIIKELRQELQNEQNTAKKKVQETENKKEQEKVQLKAVEKGQDKIQKKVSKKELVNKESFHESVKNKNSEIDISTSIRYRYKDTVDVNTKQKVYEKSLTQSQRVAITIAKKERERSKAELSAQIMNVPFEEFKESISSNITKNDSLFGKLNLNEMIKPDILTRLKEIYETCSCKVCECINGKSVPSNDNCQCKPSDRYNKLGPHAGCPCVACDRKDCRGVVKNKDEVKDCECEPCDCVKYTIQNKPCTCEPCQCIECTVNMQGGKQYTPNSNIQENLEQNFCQCEPCECISCAYTAAANSTIRREISFNNSYKRSQCGNCLKDICQSDTGGCGCAQHEAMKKPIQGNSNQKTSSKYDTIAMFALSDNYSNIVFNTNNKKNCQCLECDCIVCKNRERKINSSDVPSNVISPCKCLPCECQVCTLHKYTERKHLGFTSFQNNSGCNKCDCIVCEGLNCNGSSICKKVNEKLVDTVPRYVSSKNIYPLKKGKLLTPNMFGANNLEPCIENQPNLVDYDLNNHTDKNFDLRINPKELFNSKICNQHQNLLLGRSKIKNVECRNLKTVSSENSDHLHKDITSCNTEFVQDMLDSKILTNNSKNSIKLRKSRANSNVFARLYSVSDANIQKALKDNSLHESSFPVTNKPSNTNAIFSNDITALDCLNYIAQQYINEFEIHNIKEKSEKIKDDTETEFERNMFLGNKYSILSIYKSSSKSFTVCNKISTILKTEETDTKLEKVNIMDSNITLKQYKSIEFNNKIKSKSIDYKTEANDVTFKNKGKVKQNKMYSRLIKRTQVRKSRRRNKQIKKSKFKGIKDEGVKEYLEQSNENIEKPNGDKLYSEVITSIDDMFSSELDLLKKIKMEVQDINKDVNDPFSILRKNLYLNCEEVRPNKSVWTIPDLDLIYVKTVSLQTSDDFEKSRERTLMDSGLALSVNATSQTLRKTLHVEKETNCNLFESLENLYKNIKGLLDITLGHAVDKSDDITWTRNFIQNLGWEMQRTNSDKSSCHGLKAHFLELRRVSDHTVLVRWKLPQELTYVQGYELQVDGLTIQKILNPARCMAVLTCLPNCDKLLLTIRTLITSDLQSDHYPATTIVYRPRFNQ